MKKILVTGGAGFIGSNLVDALIEKGHEVYVVDNLSTGRKENINQKAEFFEVDITDKTKLEEVFTKVRPEAVLHLAAQISVEVSTKNPDEDVKINVVGTINLLELSQKNQVKKFVFSSTGGAIYGDDAPRPTTEDAKAEPMTPYGIDKLCAEGFIRFFASRSDLNYTILRFSNVYGPRQNPGGEAGVVAILTSRMFDNKPSVIYGDGEQTRDYVFVGDIVRALIAGFESQKTGIFNVSTGIETTVNEIARVLVQLTDTKTPPKHEEGRLEQRASSLSSEKANRELGWINKVNLEEGLKQTVQWYENNLKRKNKN